MLEEQEKLILAQVPFVLGEENNEKFMMRPNSNFGILYCLAFGVWDL